MKTFPKVENSNENASALKSLRNPYIRFHE